MFNTDFETPILFIVFNRPNTTQQIFDRIRAIHPKKLFIAADGPRMDRPGEVELCRKVREIVCLVDWNCEVKTLFRDSNVGCKIGPSEAINWFFQHVEEGIILEDDCLPDRTFFPFCAEMLEKYRDDKRIMEIVGTNFLSGNGWRRDSTYSYYFSYYGWTWGWATWKRAWDLYDIQMRIYPEIKAKDYLRDLCSSKEEIKYRLKCFETVFSENLDAWDYQWQFARLVNQGLSAIPTDNLVVNIGFAEDATHTKNVKWFSKFNVPAASLSFPLKHPAFMIRDTFSDNQFVKSYLLGKREDNFKQIMRRCAKILGVEKILLEIYQRFSGKSQKIL